MEVVMIKSTAYKGFKEAGKTYGPDDGITDDIANRWINKGIAAPVVKEEEKAPNYSEMKASQLYKICLSKGLKVETKKDQAYYIDALTKAEAEGSDDDEDSDDGKDENDSNAKKDSEE